MGRSRGLSCLASVYTGEESRRRFGILACRVFTRFSALLMESAAFAYTARRDRRDVTELLKKSHRIVNEATRAQEPGDDKTHGLTFDRSQINIEKLRNESEKKVKRMGTTAPTATSARRRLRHNRSLSPLSVGSGQHQCNIVPSSWLPDHTGI